MPAVDVETGADLRLPNFQNFAYFAYFAYFVHFVHFVHFVVQILAVGIRARRGTDGNHRTIRAD